MNKVFDKIVAFKIVYRKRNSITINLLDYFIILNILQIKQIFISWTHHFILIICIVQCKMKMVGIIFYFNLIGLKLNLTFTFLLGQQKLEQKVHMIVEMYHLIQILSRYVMNRTMYIPLSIFNFKFDLTFPYSVPELCPFKW